MAAPQKIELVDTGHVGRDIIDYVHRLLVIDEEWTERHDDGFTWWSHRLAQRIRWEGPIDVDGLDTWWVSAETAFLRDVDASNPDLHAFVDEVNRQLGVGAAVIDGDRVSVRSRTYAMPESAQDRGKLIADAAIITNAILHEWLGDGGAFGGSWTADLSGHSTNGPRDEPDEMLTVLDQAHRRQGQRPADPSWDLLLNDAVETCMAGGIDAYGGEWEGVLYARWELAGIPLLCSIRRAIQHDLLGYGMAAALSVPTEHVSAALGISESLLAEELNAIELAAHLPLRSCGAWHLKEDERGKRIVQKQFIPNVAFGRGLGSLYAMDTMTRARWLVHDVLGHPG